jgi:hypothetical protein
MTLSSSQAGPVRDRFFEGRGGPGGRLTHCMVCAGNGQAAAVGPAGLAAIRKFVSAGKGYIGTCGGSFLGIQHVGFYLPTEHTPCGDVSRQDKLTQPHCTPATQEPFDRGDGNVLVEFTQAGLAQLRLPRARFGGNTTIFYAQGPIVKAAALPPWVAQLAFYRSEIHSKHTANTTGEMVGTVSFCVCLFMREFTAGICLLMFSSRK